MFLAGPGTCFIFQVNGAGTLLPGHAHSSEGEDRLPPSALRYELRTDEAIVLPTSPGAVALSLPPSLSRRLRRLSHLPLS